MPHMHLRGKDFLYEAIYPDGKKEILLSVPRYDFNWQSIYRLAEPLALPKYTKIHCIAHFDNSANNPNNPDPKKNVFWGFQTWDEMMTGWFDYYYDDENPRDDARLDSKHGRRLSPEILPGAVWGQHIQATNQLFFQGFPAWTVALISLPVINRFLPPVQR
jgi:hypothetical protein